MNIWVCLPRFHYPDFHHRVQFSIDDWIVRLHFGQQGHHGRIEMQIASFPSIHQIENLLSWRWISCEQDNFPLSCRVFINTVA